MSAGKRDPQLSDPALARTVWSKIVKAAEDKYIPGRFTTFAGFEWTSNPQKRNLHRVVVFRDTAHVPDLVLSALDSDNPEMLWKWMEEQRVKGSTLLAIRTTATRATAHVRDGEVRWQVDRCWLQQDPRRQRAAL
jgi:hypothetical protein